MIRLEDTTSAAVARAISAERIRMGAPATGMVLTLIVLSDEESQADATHSAMFAAREHPMRILVMVNRKGRSEPRLDAEVSVGGDDGPGEVAVLRLRGELAHHPGSVVIPLLLPDTPIVAYWPSHAPDSPSTDSIGKHAQRRITDSATSARPNKELAIRRANYHPGDTDLAWTRITPWRSMLAAALDNGFPTIESGEVTVQRSVPSGALLASWLEAKLDIPISVKYGRGPGISGVRLKTVDGDIVLSRPDGKNAKLTMPGRPSATLALPRRDLGDLLVEELRRLDADEVYAEALWGLGSDDSVPETL